jgi:hypothetical protein
MNGFFICFWVAMILLSIAWYAIMLFYVGIKGGHEILQMIRNLSKEVGDDYTVRRQPPDRT